MSKPTLHYFAGYGRAEAIRMLLTHAKVEFKDERIGFGDWPALKASGKFPGGVVPVWETDGHFLNQTQSILRMLGS
jgi:glutathione S-transferase